jgi:hypothetical protein
MTDRQQPIFFPGFAALFRMFSKDKLASAVFCISIDGAWLNLENSVQAGASTSSPACEPGCDGGQDIPQKMQRCCTDFAVHVRRHAFLHALIWAVKWPTAWPVWGLCAPAVPRRS